MLQATQHPDFQVLLNKTGRYEWFELEKTYLKSQVDSLKLQARWAKPYLKAAQQLEMNEELGARPDLVNMFNTIILELTLMGKSPISVKDAAHEGDLPKDFAKKS